MKVAIIGTGYVGLPTGVGLAELGHDVVCIDREESKITPLKEGKITLFLFTAISTSLRTCSERFISSDTSNKNTIQSLIA